MFVRTKSSPNSPRKTVQIVESLRVDGKVKQRIVQHVGVASDDAQLEILINLATQLIPSLQNTKDENSAQLTLFNDDSLLETSAAAQVQDNSDFERELPEDCDVCISSMINEETVIDGPMEVVEKLFHQMGLNRIFSNSNRDFGKINLLKQAIAAAFTAPSSKRAMVKWLQEECCVGDVSLDRVYRLMDFLAQKESRVKEVVRAASETLIPAPPTLMLFDVTTLYFESFTEDELRQCGYSKDNKFKETQIVLALATNTEGLPIWYEIFPGKTSEGATLASFADVWRQKEYPGSTGVVVADRAMGMAANVAMMKESGLDYVFGAKLKSMKGECKREILRLAEYSELESGVKYKILKQEDGSSLLVTWDAKRAQKDKSDRERLVSRAEKKLNASGRTRGKVLIGNRGSARYFKEEGESVFVLDEAKIRLESEWDGLHGLRTSLSLRTPEDVEKALAHYASLWRIEESFRIKKHDLRIRPIYHWTESRIRGHIALSYLVFACTRVLERRVELQQKERMSPEKLRKALLSVTSTLMRDRRTGKLYRFPKRLESSAGKIYRSLGLQRSGSVKEVTSREKYRNRRSHQRKRRG